MTRVLIVLAAVALALVGAAAIATAFVIDDTPAIKNLTAFTGFALIGAASAAIAGSEGV